MPGEHNSMPGCHQSRLFSRARVHKRNHSRCLRLLAPVLQSLASQCVTKAHSLAPEVAPMHFSLLYARVGFTAEMILRGLCFYILTPPPTPPLQGRGVHAAGKAKVRCRPLQKTKKSDVVRCKNQESPMSSAAKNQKVRCRPLQNQKSPMSSAAKKRKVRCTPLKC